MFGQVLGSLKVLKTIVEASSVTMRVANHRLRFIHRVVRTVATQAAASFFVAPLVTFGMRALLSARLRFYILIGIRLQRSGMKQASRCLLKKAVWYGLIKCMIQIGVIGLLLDVRLRMAT